jgi:hypothetical protein
VDGRKDTGKKRGRRCGGKREIKKEGESGAQQGEERQPANTSKYFIRLWNGQL